MNTDLLVSKTACRHKIQYFNDFSFNFLKKIITVALLPIVLLSRKWHRVASIWLMSKCITISPVYVENLTHDEKKRWEKVKSKVQIWKNQLDFAPLFLFNQIQLIESSGIHATGLSGEKLLISRKILTEDEDVTDFLLSHEFHHFHPSILQSSWDHTVMTLSLIADIAMLVLFPPAILLIEFGVFYFSTKHNRTLEHRIDHLATKHLGSTAGAEKYFNRLMEIDYPEIRVLSLEDKRSYKNAISPYHFISHPSHPARISYLENQP